MKMSSAVGFCFQPATDIAVVCVPLPGNGNILRSFATIPRGFNRSYPRLAIQLSHNPGPFAPGRAVVVAAFSVATNLITATLTDGLPTVVATGNTASSVEASTLPTVLQSIGARSMVVTISSPPTSSHVMIATMMAPARSPPPLWPSWPSSRPYPPQLPPARARPSPRYHRARRSSSRISCAAPISAKQRNRSSEQSLIPLKSASISTLSRQSTGHIPAMMARTTNRPYFGIHRSLSRTAFLQTFL